MVAGKFLKFRPSVYNLRVFVYVRKIRGYNSTPTPIFVSIVVQYHCDGELYTGAALFWSNTTPIMYLHTIIEHDLVHSIRIFCEQKQDTKTMRNKSLVIPAATVTYGFTNIQKHS